ncbi:MAG: GGDEF domain-containing protein [Oscillospiraceae bacterium]|nr:GGDEF domain-containing protein [Oscillospiraceae bacterium]
MNKKKTGVSAKSIIIPAVIVIFIMHLAIVGNTIRINRAGKELSEVTQNNFTYAQMVKTLQNTSDILADKARLYVSTGDAEYLIAYVTELRIMVQRDSSMAKSIESYQNESAREQMDSAKEIALRRSRMECRAMKLCAIGNGFEISEFPEIAQAQLSATEEAFTAAEKKEMASRLLVSPEYLQLINQSSDHINRAVQVMSDATAEDLVVKSATLRSYQILQWAMTITIIIILSIMCVLLFTLLLKPLEHSADDVSRGEPIPPKKGLAEFRRLATAYNELLHHRKMMETYLRQQSQTDALTGLPNRLAFQNFVSQLSWEKAHSSVIVFSLDVNGLKETNDHKGHTFGDALLRNCALCIQEALGTGEGKNCFRFGGDEFAAFWVDVPATELDAALKKFVAVQEEREVSISVGCAYAEDLSETTVDKLFEEADRNMYDEKAEYHRRQAQAVLDSLKLDFSN